MNDHFQDPPSRRQPFGLTANQQRLQQMARAFAVQEIMPVAEKHDRTATYPQAVADQARALGLLNTCVPRSHGGPGYSVLEETIIAEEFSFACSGIWSALVINNLATIPILVGALGDLRERWLRLIVAGMTPAFALTEPGGGSDVAGIRTVARRDGGTYVISGAKRYISNATVADIFVIFAKTDPRGERRGISAFLVPTDSPGVEVCGQFDKAAHRAYDTSELELHEVRVPAENRLGAEGDGFRLAMATFDRNRPTVAGAAVGVAGRALAEASAYASSRHAFGEPIARFQAIGHKLADIATGVEAARLLAWRAAAEFDMGVPNTASASMAKAFATDLAMRAAIDAVQIYGAAGIMRHNPVEKLLRDAKVLQVYEGTNEIQRNIIVRELMRPYATALFAADQPING
ncbi:MAG: acyl-CoA dehydrogenase family protein [Pseudonocardiaceae bacterium]